MVLHDDRRRDAGMEGEQVQAAASKQSRWPFGQTGRMSYSAGTLRDSLSGGTGAVAFDGACVMWLKTPIQSQPARPLIGLILLASALMAAGAGFIGFVLWPRWPDPASSVAAPSLPITVNGVVFNVPPSAIRVRAQRQAGPQDRVELAFLWPDLRPPDAIEKPVLDEQPGGLDRLFVTLAALSDLLSPTARLNQIYQHYFVPTPFAGPDGLIVRRFRDGSPYQGVDLFYDPGATEGFVARCSRPGTGGTPGVCLFERRIADAVDVTVRFPRDWLAAWRPLASDIDLLITRLQAPRGGRWSSSAAQTTRSVN